MLVCIENYRYHDSIAVLPTQIEMYRTALWTKIEQKKKFRKDGMKKIRCLGLSEQSLTDRSQSQAYAQNGSNRNGETDSLTFVRTNIEACFFSCKNMGWIN